MRRNTPSNKLIRGSRCPCPIGGSRRACGAGRASSRRAEQSSRHGQQAGRPRCRWAAAGPGRASRRRAKRTISNQAPAVWRPPRGLRGLAAVPEGGGRARADYPAALSSARLEAAAGPAGPAGPGRGAGGRRQGLAAVPEGGGRAWPGFEIDHSEPQARVWRSRGRAAAHRHTQRPNPTRRAPRRPGPTAPGKPVVPQAPPESQNSS